MQNDFRMIFHDQIKRVNLGDLPNNLTVEFTPPYCLGKAKKSSEEGTEKESYRELKETSLLCSEVQRNDSLFYRISKKKMHVILLRYQHPLI